MKPLSHSIDTAIDDIRASDAFVIVGAGASFQAGMPLVGQLSPMMWHALESNPKLLGQVCDNLGVARGTAKRVIADDRNRMLKAFELIAEDGVARRAFQKSVCDLNNSRCRDMSAPHEALARLIFAGRIMGILSLNWDTLLERAFLRNYGFWPSSSTFDFWKPHGDCADAGKDWVLPHERGVVSEDIVRKVSGFADARPRVLMIVGYSESDETVVERFIAPMAERWRVYRISPGAAGDGAIRMDAGTALESLANALAPRETKRGWNSVSFDSQRGIEAAIAGERLGPGDVISCPRLPHFSAALTELDTLHRVNIAGTSGSGKSITVWQLAHHYNQAGWHVVRPSHAPLMSDRERIEIVAQKRWPTIVVVDDTQSQADDFLDAIRTLADVRTKVVFGTTDANWEQENTIRVSSVSSVNMLVKEFKRRRDEVLPIVQKFDSHVDDSFLSIRIEDRIASAADCPTPWQFTYALRGGWRQARHIMNAVRDFDGYDYLLAARCFRHQV